MPTSPFEAKGQRGMPSAGIALSIKTDSPFVPVSHRALVVRTGTRNTYFDRNEGRHETKIKSCRGLCPREDPNDYGATAA